MLFSNNPHARQSLRKPELPAHRKRFYHPAEVNPVATQSHIGQARTKKNGAITEKKVIATKTPRESGDFGQKHLGALVSW
jgi:hypothetical protein